MLDKRVVFMILIIISFGLILIYNVFEINTNKIIISYFYKTNEIAAIDNKQIVQLNIKFDYKLNFEKVKYEINTTYDNNNMIVNNNLVQYSAYLTIISNDTIRIESIILSLTPDQVNTDNLKCLFKYFNQIKIVPVKVMYGCDTYSHIFWKVSCEYQFDKNNTSEFKIMNFAKQTYIAIILSNNYDFDANKTIDETIASNKLTLSYINYHKPMLIDARIPKKQAAAHCLQMGYDLDIENRTINLFEWLKIQKALGVEQIKMYVFRMKNRELLNNLLDMVEKRMKRRDYIIFVHHEVNFEGLCARQIADLNRNNSSNFHKYLHDKCFQVYERLFRVMDVNGLFSAHEKITSNDCYMSLRYQYQIMANYDFDEVIFGHLNKFHDVENDNLTDQLNDKLCIHSNKKDDRGVCKVNFDIKFNLYDFAWKLFNEVGVKKVGVLRFLHAPVFYNDLQVNIHAFINEIEEILLKYTTQNQTNVQHSVKLYGTQNKDRVVTYTFEFPTHLDYIKKLIRNYKIIRCLENIDINSNQKTINDYLKNHFNRYVICFMPVRLGKSLLNTDYVEIINPHNADNFNQGDIISFDVPFELGYATHFREIMYGFMNQEHYDITQIRIEPLYYFNLVKSFCRT